MTTLYNARRETFTCDPILNIVLSTKATPPADFTLIPTDFTHEYLYSGTAAGVTNPHIKFDVRDKPRIVGVGLFSNIADGLVYQDNPDRFQDGPSFSLVLQVFDINNAVIAQADVQQTFRVSELNQIFETDYLFDVSTVTEANNPGQDSLRFLAGFDTNSMSFATISIDPLYATKRFIIRPVVIIEHTFPTTYELPPP